MRLISHSKVHISLKMISGASKEWLEHHLEVKLIFETSGRTRQHRALTWSRTTMEFISQLDALFVYMLKAGESEEKMATKKNTFNIWTERLGWKAIFVFNIGEIKSEWQILRLTKRRKPYSQQVHELHLSSIQTGKSTRKGPSALNCNFKYNCTKYLSNC